jgi:hypothetical protein
LPIGDAFGCGLPRGARNWIAWSCRRARSASRRARHCRPGHRRGRCDANQRSTCSWFLSWRGWRLVAGGCRSCHSSRNRCQRRGLVRLDPVGDQSRRPLVPLGCVRRGRPGGNGGQIRIGVIVARWRWPLLSHLAAHRLVPPANRARPGIII